MESNGNGRVTYAEVRRIARWLGCFTAGDLADALHVHEAVGEQFVKALLFHRLAVDTGETVELNEGPVAVFEMEPLPDTVYPRIHHMPPEVMAVIEMGGFWLFDERGVQQRVVSHGERGRQMSTSGARLRLKLKQQRFDQMVEARKQRAEKQRLKAQQRKAEGKREWEK